MRRSPRGASVNDSDPEGSRSSPRSLQATATGPSAAQARPDRSAAELSAAVNNASEPSRPLASVARMEREVRLIARIPTETMRPARSKSFLSEGRLARSSSRSSVASGRASSASMWARARFAVQRPNQRATSPCGERPVRSPIEQRGLGRGGGDRLELPAHRPTEEGPVEHRQPALFARDAPRRIGRPAVRDGGDAQPPRAVVEAAVGRHAEGAVAPGHISAPTGRAKASGTRSGSKRLVTASPLRRAHSRSARPAANSASGKRAPGGSTLRASARGKPGIQAIRARDARRRLVAGVRGAPDRCRRSRRGCAINGGRRARSSIG